MGVVADEWLGLMDREYLQAFIAGGGSVVKFVEVDSEKLEETRRG
jgi:hypothetical protein